MKHIAQYSLHARLPTGNGNFFVEMRVPVFDSILARKCLGRRSSDILGHPDFVARFAKKYGVRFFVSTSP